MPMSLIERFNNSVRKSFAILNQGLELNDSLYEIKHIHLPVLLKLQPPPEFFENRQLSNDYCCIFRHDSNECPLANHCLLISLDFNEITNSCECVEEFLKELLSARKSFDLEQRKVVDNQCINVIADLLHLESVLSYLSVTNSLDKSLERDEFIKSLIDIINLNFELLNDILRPDPLLFKLKESNLPVYENNELPSHNIEEYVKSLEDHMKAMDYIRGVTLDARILFQFLDQSRHLPIIIYNDKSINLSKDFNHIKHQAIILLQTLYCYNDINWYIYNRDISLIYNTNTDDYYHFDRLALIYTDSTKLDSIISRAKLHKGAIEKQFVAKDYGPNALLPLLKLDIPYLTLEVVALLLLFSENDKILKILSDNNIGDCLLHIIEQECAGNLKSLKLKIGPLNIVNLNRFKSEIENSLKISLVVRNSLLLLLKLSVNSENLMDKLSAFITDYITLFCYDSINKLGSITTIYLPIISKCLNTLSLNNSNLSLQRTCVELLFILVRFKPNSDLTKEIEYFFSEVCKFLWLQKLDITTITTPCILFKHVDLPPSILDSKSKIIYDKYKMDDFTLFDLLYMLSIGNKFQNEKCQILLQSLMCDGVLVNKYWDTITCVTNVHSVQNWLQDLLSNVNDDRCIEQGEVVANLISIALVPEFDLGKLQHIYGVHGNILQLIGSLLQSIIEICDFNNTKHSSIIRCILNLYLDLLFLIKYCKCNNTNLLHFINWKCVIKIMAARESAHNLVLAGVAAMVFGLVCDIFQVNRFHELGIDLGNSISDYPKSIGKLIDSEGDSVGKVVNDLPNKQLNYDLYLWSNYRKCKLIIGIQVYKTFIHEGAMSVLLELAQRGQISVQPHSTPVDGYGQNAILTMLGNAVSEQQDATREIAHLYATISKMNRQMAVLARAYFQADDSLRRAKYDLQQLNVPVNEVHNLKVQYEELKYKHEKLLELLGRIEESFPEAVAICKSKFE